MARIQAGSTLVNQYVPPFVVSDNVAQGWELQWNSTLQAFEAIDPNANTPDAGFDVIQVKIYENVTQQRFTLPWAADSKQSLIITIDGVKQHQDAYTFSSDTETNTTIVTLADTVSNETVEFLGLQATGGASINVFGPQAIDSNIAGTVNPYFDIGWFAPSEESLIITVDGVKQATNNYSVQATPGSNFTNTRVTFPDRAITFQTDASGINAATEVITTGDANGSLPHGFSTGQGVYYSTDGGTSDVGLVNNTLYYVRVLSTYTIELYDTGENADPQTNTGGIGGTVGRLDLNTATTETHALTLITDPYLYVNVNTIAVVNGGTGYAESDILTVNGGSPVVEAQIRVDSVDDEAQFTFTTDVGGTVDSIVITNPGSGYPASGGGTFNISVASDPNFVAGTEALITYTTDGTGAVDSAVVTNAGTGYDPSLPATAVSIVDTPNPNLGEITGFSVLNSGEYVVFPTPNPVSTSGGSGAGATFNIFRVSPIMEIIGITTTGETPASPVNATNLSAGTAIGVFDSKTVTGDTQVLNFKSLAAGSSNISIVDSGDFITIDSVPTALSQSGGGGTTLFDNNDPAAGVFKTVQTANSRILLSTTGTSPNEVLLLTYNFGFVNVTSTANGILANTARLVHVTHAGPTTVALPVASALPAGDTITIKDGVGLAGTHTITIAPDGTDQIDGVNANIELTTDNAYRTLYSDGTHWHIIAQG